MSPHPGLFLTELLGQGLAGLPSCLAWVSLQGRLLPEEFLLPTCARLGLWDLHGYEAGHGGLETIKDVASGEGHEVVHEGRQGEDE